jgi:hypothetical protein
MSEGWIRDAPRLLETAHALACAAAVGPARVALDRRHLARVASPAGPPHALCEGLEEAAIALGARVSRLAREPWPGRASAAGADVLQALARLYDGLVCDELPADEAAALALGLGRPVYAGAAVEAALRQLEALAPAAGPKAPAAEWLLRALLVHTLEH